MILMFFVNVIKGVISGVMAAIPDYVTIPIHVISVLGNITGFGVYVVGGDILLIVVANIMFWMAAKLLIGLALFIWRLLPLT